MVKTEQRGAVELRDYLYVVIALQCGMPWTIPNLLFHDKPVPLSNMRSHGRNHVLPDGRELVILCDARDYITSLPKAEQDLEELRRRWGARSGPRRAATF
jgi:hypothetical protein